MADEAEDVLDLEQVVSDGEGLEALEDQQTDGEGDEDQGEPDFAFADEAAPAPEQDNSTIRKMRDDLRAAQRELAEFRKQSAPKPIEVGPKPVLAECGEAGYDEDVYEAELLKWNDRRLAAERQAGEVESQRETAKREWQGRIDTYEASKATVPGIDDAEQVVEAALGEDRMRILMLVPEDAPKLIAALAKSPDKLETLSKLDLARAAMMIGELKGKVQMTTRKVPAPDAPLRGNAAIAGSTDKQLQRLEAEAEKTGDRTELIRYRRKLAA